MLIEAYDGLKAFSAFKLSVKIHCAVAEQSAGTNIVPG